MIRRRTTDFGPATMPPGAYFITHEGYYSIGLYCHLHGDSERYGWYLFGRSDPIPRVDRVGRVVESNSTAWDPAPPQLRLISGGEEE